MKRIFILTMALLGMTCGAVADNVVVSDVTVPQGGQTTLEIGFNFDSGKTYTGCQFDLSLPEGLATQKDAAGLPVVTAGSGLSNHTITPSTVASGDDRFVVLSFTKAPISGTSGTVLSVTLTAGTELNAGDSFTASVKNITFTTVDVENMPFDDVTFTVTVGEPADTRVVLDEAATAQPETASNVDVRVKRSIKAGEWSTLVLPFAMTEAQVKEAFGADVELADFTSWTSEEDEDGNIVGITVGFSDISEIEANHPCIIKTSADVTEFTVDGVDIEAEDEPTVQVGKKKAERGYMIGTYVSGTAVPENDLFLSENQFWYSKGLTRMKAMRAYFEFADVLTSVEEGAGAKVRFSFRQEDATAIQSIAAHADEDAVYSISGVRMNADKHLPKGLYIVNGKKVLIK